jgi:hypothetical protein
MFRRANRRHTLLIVLFCAAFSVLSSSVWAQGFGVRGGVSIDPDQVFIGAHYETAALVERLHFKPNLEIGFGDDLTLVAGNFEFVWKFPERNNLGFYAGGGPGVNFYSADNFDETEAGFNLLAGVETARGLQFELKIGLLDSPDLKFMVGYTFK